MTQRTQRVDELLREEISQIVARDIEDPRVGFVTITRVEVSADLRHGTVWASVIGDADERKATIRALGRAMPFVRHRLGALHIRRIPELHLRLDESAEKGTRVLTILHELEEGHEPGPAPAAETLPTPRRAAHGHEQTKLLEQHGAAERTKAPKGPATEVRPESPEAVRRSRASPDLPAS